MPGFDHIQSGPTQISILYEYAVTGLLFDTNTLSSVRDPSHFVYADPVAHVHELSQARSPRGLGGGGGCKRVQLNPPPPPPPLTRHFGAQVTIGRYGQNKALGYYCTFTISDYELGFIFLQWALTSFHGKNYETQNRHIH